MTSIFLLFSIGGAEIVFILLIIVMLFGADKIPELARGLGKGIREVRTAANDIKSEITNSTTSDDETLKKFKDKVEKGGKRRSEDVVGSVKRNVDL